MTEGTEGHPADAGVVAGAAPSADLVADLEHELRETRQASIAALLTGTALIRVAAAGATVAVQFYLADLAHGHPHGTTIGLVGTAQAISEMVFAPFLARFADRLPATACSSMTDIDSGATRAIGYSSPPIRSSSDRWDGWFALAALVWSGDRLATNRSGAGRTTGGSAAGSGLVLGLGWASGLGVDPKRERISGDESLEMRRWFAATDADLGRCRSSVR